LRKDSFAGSEPMDGAVAEPDFHAAGQCNYVLAAGRVMPIDERAWSPPGEHHPRCGVQSTLPCGLSPGTMDPPFFQMKLVVGTAIERKQSHNICPPRASSRSTYRDRRLRASVRHGLGN